MALVYITGIAGAGKSAVCQELKVRGYETHEVDDGLANFYNNESGQPVDRPRDPSERTPQWRSQHTWKISREPIAALAKHAENMPVFVCGTASNDDEIIDLFDKVLALVVDEETLIYRIKTRTTSDFGKVPHELATIIDWQKTAADDYRNSGAILVNATQPIDKVVDEILAKTAI